MLRKKRILIVEDEESLLKLETILLTVKGYEVIPAFTGKMAIDKIGVEEFDLVLLDIMLPDIDGYEVCKQIKADSRTASVPVIMLTGKKTQEDHDKGVQAGADAYLVKPFKSAMIIEEITRILGRSGAGA
jgi:twitching motility two-component system response regulator PilG